MSLTGEPQGPPTKIGVPIADLTAGMMAAYGVVTALYARERTGLGQKVDIGLLDSQVALLTYQGGISFASGQPPLRTGNCHASIVPYGTFPCADGYINLAVGNDSLWKKFCRVLERPDLVHHPDYETASKRVVNGEALKAVLNDILGRDSSEHWIQKLRAQGIPAGPIHDLTRILTHPQTLAREMGVEADHPVAGKTSVTGVPVKLSKNPGAVHSPPLLGVGEHTEEVLGNLLGRTAEEIARLRDAGVV